MQETQEMWVGKIPWGRKCQPAPLFLPGESHGQRRPAGYSPRGHKESNTTETPEHACPLCLFYLYFICACTINVQQQRYLFNKSWCDNMKYNTVFRDDHFVVNRKRSMSRLYIVTLLISLICSVHNEERWAGRSTS